MAAETVLSSGVSCHCGCHDSGFETCPFCERHPELHVSAPVLAEANDRSNSPAPRKETRLKPPPAEPALVGRRSNQFTVAIAILTPIIFFLGLYLYGTGAYDVYTVNNEANRVSLSEADAFYQSGVVIFWMMASAMLATIGVSVVGLIGMSLYVIFSPLALLSAFLLKPILLPVVYPFVGAWTAIRYSAIGVWLTACFGVRFMRNLLFFPSFCRRHVSICNSWNSEEDDCCITSCVAVFSIMMIGILFAWVALAQSNEPVPVLLPIIAVSLLSTNCLSGLYELGRWYHNKRAPQATKEKPNPIV